MKKPRCPCGRKGTPDGIAGNRQRYRCPLGHLFDGAPSEGSDVFADPSRRLELLEEQELARKHNDRHRDKSSRGYRL